MPAITRSRRHRHARPANWTKCWQPASAGHLVADQHLDGDNGLRRHRGVYEYRAGAPGRLYVDRRRRKRHRDVDKFSGRSAAKCDNPLDAALNATQGGTYQVSATATSLNTPPTLVIADTASATVCTMSGTYLVTFKGPGTCTITFNDPGNANYAPALQVTQSFQVGGQTATQVGVVLATTTPNASGTTNDLVTVTLENAVGFGEEYGNDDRRAERHRQRVLRRGDRYDGRVDVHLGHSEWKFVGDGLLRRRERRSGLISVVNGTNVWGTAALTIVSGVPTQVAITPSTTTPGVSSSTSPTLSLQLEDAYGNLAASATPITLTLSAGSEPAFFVDAGFPALRR